MNLQSVRARFLGSYIFLLVLFVLQLPLIYLLVGGMSSKYGQVAETASLRMRALEINYILNRHILNGEEELDKVFFEKKDEFARVLEGLKTGSTGLKGITEKNVLAKLEAVNGEWAAMSKSMVEAMESGDRLSEVMREIEDTTFPMVEKMNSLVTGLVALKDPSLNRNIDLAGLQRMRTVKMAYLMERYARSNYDLNNVSATLSKTITEFEATLRGLREGSAELGLWPVRTPALLSILGEAETLWAKRKTLIDTGIKSKDSFHAKLAELSNVHTPAIVARAEDLTSEISSTSANSGMKALVTMALAILVTSCVAVFFMWSSNVHILKPLMKVKQTVEAIAAGDLSRRAEIKVRFLGKDLDDEVVSLGKSVDGMGESMSLVIGKIADSSNQLASAAEQLSASSGQIATGADRQSNQTGQAATAMEEMSATVIEVARNSQQASESAKNAQLIARKGGHVVDETIAAMQEVADSTSSTGETIRRLGKSSEEIGSIISVINEIAEQTNLLALNAAIEAARAGDQGRGFAVVADEVRKLAERTTGATKEISGMIQSIQSGTARAVDEMGKGIHKVENGVKLANDTGNALREIVDSVESVCEMISHIATSAEQQSATTEEITSNMDSIAEVSRNNVAAIGEVSNATDELARLATELKTLVSNFRLEEGSGDLRHAHDHGRAGAGLRAA